MLPALRNTSWSHGVAMQMIFYYLSFLKLKTDTKPKLSEYFCLWLSFDDWSSSAVLQPFDFAQQCSELSRNQSSTSDTRVVCSQQVWQDFTWWNLLHPPPSVSLLKGNHWAMTHVWCSLVISLPLPGMLCLLHSFHDHCYFHFFALKSYFWSSGRKLCRLTR